MRILFIGIFLFFTSCSFGGEWYISELKGCSATAARHAKKKKNGREYPLYDFHCGQKDDGSVREIEVDD